MQRFNDFARAALWTAMFLSMPATAAYHTGTPPDDLPRIVVSPLVTPWAKRAVHGGIAYFLYPSSAKVARLDLGTQTWLADIPVPANAITFDVDADGIFVALTDRVVRLDLAGTSTAVVPNVPGGQTTLELGPGFVLVANGPQHRTYSKSDGSALGASTVWYSVRGPSVLSGSGRIYMSYSGLSPSDILYIQADLATGALATSVESPYHGDWPAGWINYASEQSDLVVDNTGTVYSEQLDYRGSLGGLVEAIAYLPDRFVVMRGGEFIVFSNALRELGRLPAPTGTVDILSAGGTAYAVKNTGSVTATALDLAAARKPAPGIARGWSRTAMHADEVLDAGAGLIFVSKSESAAYRFDPQSWSFAPALALLPNPDRVAYSPVLDTLFASYSGGAIYGHPFAQLGTANYLNSTAMTPSGLVAADDVVLAADYSGAWSAHYTFGPDGERRSWVDWNYSSGVYTWDPVLRKVFFFRDGTSPNDLHWEQIGTNGEITAEGESPYHGELQAIPPIRISPNHATIALGSGQMLSTTSLTFTRNLLMQVADVAWSGGGEYAVSAESPPRFVRFDGASNVLSSGRVRGTPRRLMTMENGNFLYVGETSGRTIAGVLDPLLVQADLAVDPLTSSGALVAGGSNLTITVTVGNNGSVAAQGARVTADFSQFQNVTWRCIPDAFVTGCADQVQSGPLDQVIGLGDGGQARYVIMATVPAAAMASVALPMQVSAPTNTTDPELRNNGARVEFNVDRLFKDGYGG